MPYTHYIVVRRDLTPGALVAMVAHAAGESFYQLASCLGSSGSERPVSNGEVDSSPLSRGSTFNPSDTIVVVLGARNEFRLQKLQARLKAAAVNHSAITETEGAYAGQLLAIGLMPGPKADLFLLVEDFQMLRL